MYKIGTLQDPATYTHDGSFVELLKEKTRTNHPLCAGRKCPKCLKRMNEWYSEIFYHSAACGGDFCETGLRDEINFECYEANGGCGYSIKIEFSPCEDPTDTARYIESTADRTGNCMICGEELESMIQEHDRFTKHTFACGECVGNDRDGKDSNWNYFKITIWEPKNDRSCTKFMYEAMYILKTKPL